MSFLQLIHLQDNYKKQKNDFLWLNLRFLEVAISVTDTKTQERLVTRRVRLVLFEPTRDSETEIVLPYEYWSKKFDNMTPRQYATYIKSLAEGIDVDKFQKKTRGPKKKVKKKFDPKVNHVSTFRILNDRK